MEAVERQKRLLDEHVATLFQQWEQQLREQIKRCDVLHEEVNALQQELNVKNETVSRLTDENAQLKEEVVRSQLMSGPDDYPHLKALIEKHNNLYREHELLKSTAAADQRDLITRLRKEREKLRSWNRFSSPGPRPARSPLTVAPPTGPSCADLVDGCANRIHFPGNEEHAECPPHGEGYVSQTESERVLARDGQRASESNDGQRFRDSQGNLDAVQSHDAVPKESKVIDQLKKPLETDSSFVDSHLSYEPRGPSPELPSIPEKRRSLTALNGEMLADTDQAAIQESLPQVQRSDSTAPPSEVLAAVDMDEASAGNDSGSDTPQFLGTRSVSKNVTRGVPATGCRPAGSAMEPVTIKSDPDTTFAASKPPQLNRLTSSADESLDPSTSICEQGSPRKQRPHPAQHLPPSDAALREGLVEMQSVAPHRSPSEPVSLRGQTSNRQRRNDGNAGQPAPLRPTDGNARKLPRTAKASSGLKSKKRRSYDNRGVGAIPAISEDGEEFVKRARKASRDYTSSKRPTNQSAHLRLDGLLTEQSDRKAPLIPTSEQHIADMEECLTAASVFCTPSSKRSYKALIKAGDRDWEWWDEAKELLESKHMKTPSIPFWQPPKNQQRKPPRVQGHTTPKPAPMSGSTIERRSASTTRPTARPIPRLSSSHDLKAELASSAHTPYRTLPLSSLSLSHFKPNPRANHNLTYAYTDVVRDQSERKCLPGCTRPECCGRKFTALAQTLPPQPRPRARLNQSTTTATNKPTTAPNRTPDTVSSISNPADETALKSYLGNHYHTLTAQERATHLPAARAQHLADKYGKVHRHLYQRAPSPPGFWNVDFPATQEQEEERRVAEERQRAEVQRRWRESMKNVDPRERERETEKKMFADEVGLWMFADE